MQRYLAEKYMSGPKADAILARETVTTKKKKKRKQDPSTSGVGVIDEDADWGKPVRQDDAMDEDIKEAVVASDRAFKKRKRVGEDDGWVSLPPPGAESSEQAQEAEDEKPVVVTGPGQGGGLMSHADLRKKFAQDNDVVDIPTPEQQETVHRDASGRKIDTKAAKAEAARLKREEEEKAARRMEWGKGIVQREDLEKRKRDMELERGKGFERQGLIAHDVILNQSQKEEVRWNDPAAAFISKPTKKGPKKPEYKGPPPPPNRFGIKPGYRWDGVDRSNGFERKLFQRQNEKQRVGQAAYQWSAEDM
ncbi:Pre-mRNA-splicing factor cwc26 [Serendipita sp. 405]|nr:Pre-mRNA-splicing factor cwc26 [Serendipita sp. 405]